MVPGTCDPHPLQGPLGPLFELWVRVFTSQLFFDDELTDQVHAHQPYAAKGQRTRRNSGDGIYARGGSQLLLSITRDGEGYAAPFDIALQT